MITLFSLILLVILALYIYFTLPDAAKEWFWLLVATLSLGGVIHESLKSQWLNALYQLGWMLLFLFLWWRRKKVS